jgi:hypothetical protein
MIQYKYLAIPRAIEILNGLVKKKMYYLSAVDIGRFVRVHTEQMKTFQEIRAKYQDGLEANDEHSYKSFKDFLESYAPIQKLPRSVLSEIGDISPEDFLAIENLIDFS